MKSQIKLTLLLLISFLIIFTAGCAKQFQPQSTFADSPFLKIVGNKIIDSNNIEITLEGIALADPYVLRQEGHWNKEYFDKAAEWGANIVRIPVHPKYWREDSNYLFWLDKGVQWAKENNMYVIIDWHSVGNLITENFDSRYDGAYITTTAETHAFWATIADYYKNEPTVAFYEIFNEPNKITWGEWKPEAERIINTIFAENPNAIPLVAGPDWAYDLREIANNPINKPGIAYAVHPYPDKDTPWDTYFGYVKNNYPVIATEFGFDPNTTEHYRGDSTYGNNIVNYLRNKKIPWTVWCFHPTWGPNLIEDWNYNPSEQGNNFIKLLRP